MGKSTAMSSRSAGSGREGPACPGAHRPDRHCSEFAPAIPRRVAPQQEPASASPDHRTVRHHRTLWDPLGPSLSPLFGRAPTHACALRGSAKLSGGGSVFVSVEARVLQASNFPKLALAFG